MDFIWTDFQPWLVLLYWVNIEPHLDRFLQHCQNRFILVLDKFFKFCWVDLLFFFGSLFGYIFIVIVCWCLITPHLLHYLNVSACVHCNVYSNSRFKSNEEWISPVGIAFGLALDDFWTILGLLFNLFWFNFGLLLDLSVSLCYMCF